MLVFGPACGFILGSFCTKIYVDAVFIDTSKEQIIVAKRPYKHFHSYKGVFSLWLFKTLPLTQRFISVTYMTETIKSTPIKDYCSSWFQGPHLVVLGASW
jgi:hypothetical protein